eukprot:7939285-Lingulodinium_polyedra.AAC.1
MADGGTRDASRQSATMDNSEYSLANRNPRNGWATSDMVNRPHTGRKLAHRKSNGRKQRTLATANGNKGTAASFPPRLLSATG